MLNVQIKVIDATHAKLTQKKTLPINACADCLIRFSCFDRRVLHALGMNASECDKKKWFRGSFYGYVGRVSLG